MSPRPVRSITPKRLEALRMVSDGRVTYDTKESSWMVDGEAVVKWEWRTFAELQNSGFISLGDGSVSTATLTPEGTKELRSG